MKVYCIGGSRNIGYYASLRLLAKGNTVTFLLRSPSVFGEDETMKDYIRSGNARLVKGDALNKEDVQRGWEEAAKPTHEGNHLGVDALLFTLGQLSCVRTWKSAITNTLRKLGGTPKFDMFKGLIISPPDLVTHATLNVLTTLPTHDLRIITVTSTGLTKQSHHELPMAMRAMYGYLLRSPHADKQGVETVLARAAGTTVDETMAPPEGILPAGWERDPTFPAPGALHDNLVIIRPAFLTDGPCHSETKGPSVVRTRVEADLPVKGGYTISRQDVAYFIAERVLGDEWEQWKGKGISLSH
ncbi:hypothetical protein PENSPDRAFT_677996 [Peniophora sp. CONT]|nr:hypothetical protein PENSPDRAFT_677996 [Peniophora sp. CONT]